MLLNKNNRIRGEKSIAELQTLHAYENTTKIIKPYGNVIVWFFFFYIFLCPSQHRKFPFSHVTAVFIMHPALQDPGMNRKGSNWPSAWTTSSCRLLTVYYLLYGNLLHLRVIPITYISGKSALMFCIQLWIK